MLLRADLGVVGLSLVGSCGQQLRRSGCWLVWDGAVVWPLAESVGFGWVLWIVGDVTGMLVDRLVVGGLVGG